MDLPFASLLHQRACATLLAYTAKTFLPILQPLSGAAEPWGFHYDFLCATPVDAVVLTLLTEEMRRNVRRDFAFDMLTMVPNNAREFLKTTQNVQAALLEQVQANVVDLAKIDTFYDIVSGELVSSTKELGDFALLHIERKEAFYEALGDVEIVRIHGVVAADKKSLKAYVKEFQAAVSQKTSKLVSLHEGYPTWYPEGLLFYDKVVDAWKALCQKQAIRHLSTPSHDTKQTHLRVLQESRITPFRTGEWIKIERTLLPQECEGLFRTKECFQDVVFRLCPPDELEQELISSLQFIQELLSMFILDTTFALVQSRAKKMQPIQERLAASTKLLQPVLETSTEKNARPRLELRATDARKRQWLAAFVEVEAIDEKGALLITQSTVFSLERLLALQLERGYKNA